MENKGQFENIRILLVEDEEKLRTTIQDYLEMNGYEVEAVQDGTAAMELFGQGEENWPQLILLDVMLPFVDGFEILEKIREKSDVPVIILTARCSEEDQLRGFSLGADDYLMKPFLLSVLKAHIEALLRRTSGGSQRKTYGILAIDRKSHKVYLEGELLILTPREYEVLVFLATNEKIVLTRDRLLDEIWGIDYNGTDRSVDTIIKQLRLKLGKAGRYIDTIYGTGYRFEVKADEYN